MDTKDLRFALNMIEQPGIPTTGDRAWPMLWFLSSGDSHSTTIKALIGTLSNKRGEVAEKLKSFKELSFVPKCQKSMGACL